jgi:hypothetical protein
MSLTKISGLSLGGFAIVSLFAFFCYWSGQIRGYEKRLIEDYQHTVYVLSQIRGEPASPLKEYLKARSYYLSNKVPTELLSKVGDFGEVDSKHLEGLQPISDSIDYGADYAQLRRRLNQ